MYKSVLLAILFLYILLQHVSADTLINILNDETRNNSVHLLKELRNQHSGLLKGAKGVLVIGIVQNSQASSLDIRSGDIIVSYAGVPINDKAGFISAVSKFTLKNVNINMVIIRNNTQLVFKLKNGKLGVWMMDVITLDTKAISAIETNLTNTHNSAYTFVQLGHESISSVAISPNGQFALSGSTDNTMKLWDIASGKEIMTFSGHSKAVTSVAFSPNGKYVLSGSLDGTICLWDIYTAKPIQTFIASSGVMSVSFSPDGEHALSVSNTIELWDLVAGRVRTMHIPDGQSGSIHSITFSPNGQQALSSEWYVSEGAFGSRQDVIRLWDLSTGQVIHTMSGHSDPINAVVFSPDGRRALSGASDKSLKLWDLATGNLIRTVNGNSGVVNTVAFSPDGRHAISGSNELTLWDTSTGEEIQNFKAPSNFNVTKSVAFSPDGRQVLSAAVIEMRLWDVATGKQIRSLHGNSGAYLSSGAVFSPDGTNILTEYGKNTNIWDSKTGKVVHILKGDNIGSLSSTFSPDGNQILSGNIDKTLMLKDTKSGKLIRTFTGHSGLIKAITFSHDGRLAISIAGYTGSIWKGIQSTQFDRTIRIWNVSTGENIRTITASEDSITNYAIFSPDEKKVLSSSGIEGMKVWDSESGKLLYQFKNNSQAVAFSPDGNYILSTNLDYSIDLLDLTTGQEIRNFKGHSNVVLSLAFSPDGKLALSGSRDNTIKLWDVATGKELRTLTGHSGSVNSVSFSPNGHLILSASRDSTARLWNTASGKELVQLIGFRDGEWISITPDGYFASSSLKASENINIRMGMTVYGIDQFYDVFYRPDIVESALAGNDTSGMVTLTIDDAIKNPPPLIDKIVIPASNAANTIKMAFRVKSTGGGIGDVRIFHNGKLIKSDTIEQAIPDEMADKKASQITSEVLVSQMRGLVRKNLKTPTMKRVIITPSKPDIYESTVEVEPVSGENDISVVAFNAQNSIQSIAQTTNFISKKPVATPHLYILAIGIDEYKDKSSALQFAVKDSRDLISQWKVSASNIYGERNIFLESISNAQANREGILSKINQIASRVKPTDHFILFVAGHGVLLGEQYYMVTSNYDGILKPSVLISANEIVDFSKRIKALSQLYILDTCHAGGMGGVISGLYDARISVLAKKMGLHVFASASSVEEALDGFEGNGLFTHTLLSGLNNNNQADKNSDKQISLIELGDYSKKQTKEIAKTLHHAQDPLTINFGQDDPVYMLK